MPKIIESLACAFFAVFTKSICKHYCVHCSSACPTHASDFNSCVFKNVIKNAPSESTVRTTALEGDIYLFCFRSCFSGQNLLFTVSRYQNLFVHFNILTLFAQALNFELHNITNFKEFWFWFHSCANTWRCACNDYIAWM